MKKLILFFLGIIGCFTAYAQNTLQYIPCTGCLSLNPSYGTVTNIENLHFASDYGPRTQNGDYDWHNGIDYGPEGGDDDLGYKILTPVECDIVKINFGNMYHWIQISGNHDYAFGHIFRSDSESGSTLGSMVMYIENFRNYIIFTDEGIALAEVTNPKQTITYNGTDYNVVTHRAAGQSIAPLGDSSADPAHVHFYEIPTLPSGGSNTTWYSENHTVFVNPLGSINYNPPNHSYQVLRADGTQGIGLTYGNNPTSIRLRDLYSSTPFLPNVDRVKFEIETPGPTFLPQAGYKSFIKGYRLKYSMFDYGGTITTNRDIYPSYLVKDGMYGSDILTGVYPHWRGQNHDDFYYSDFYLRIAKNAPFSLGNPPFNTSSTPRFANRNKDARYSDGLYKIHTTATPLVGQPKSIKNDIVIDNFFPYIEGVNVIYNNTLAYSADYYSLACNPVTPDCNKLKFYENTPSILSWGGMTSSLWEDIKMEVLASEPLSEISGNLITPLGNTININSIVSIDGGEGKRWQITYEDVTVVPLGEYQFRFYGKDLSNNELLNFDIWNGSGNVEIIPHRGENGVWQPADPTSADGSSRWYKFRLGRGVCTPSGNLVDPTINADFSSSTDCECEPYAGFVVNALQGGDNFELDASDLSGGTETLSYTWDYGDGGVSGSLASNIIKEHTYSEPGTYVIQLTVTDPCGNTATATQEITVESSPGLSAEIEGPTTLMTNQSATFDVIVSGGTPPFHFEWVVTGGSPTYIPAQQIGMHKTRQEVQFNEYTPLSPAVVWCTVKDALGNEIITSHQVTVEESFIEIDFEHLPVLPSGASCINPGSYLHWAVSVDPLFALNPPLEYIWDFGDGTIINTSEPNGQCEHPFAVSGSYLVKVKVCNPATGACYEKTKTYCVGDAEPPSNTYTLLPTKQPVITWNSPPVSIKLTTTGTFCAPIDPTFNRPKITWGQVYFPDCNYTHGLQTYDCTGDMFDEIKVPASFIPSNGIAEMSKPSDFTPWGCLSVWAYDFKTCGIAPSCQPFGLPDGAINNCIVYIKPPQIEIDNVRAEALSNCTYKLMADVSGGAQKITGAANGQYIFEDFQYEWTAYDRNNPELELGGLFDNKNAKEPMLNLNHPYIQNYEEGSNVSFLVRLRVMDSAGQVRSDGTSVSADIFRIVAKDNYKRCPGNSSYLERFPLVTGGGNYNIEVTWSVVSPAGGSLNFESGDNHDPNPYIFTPATGTVTYNMVVKMLDANGQILCQKSKNITIESSPLTLNMPSTVKACADGEQFIGPEEPFLLGGSGVYGFVWTTSNPADMNRLASEFIGRTIIKNMPIGSSVPYTLYVSDVMSRCEASATVQVTGYKNDVSVELNTPLPGCYGEPIEVWGTAGPTNSIVTYPLVFTWSSNHPAMNLFQPGVLGPIGVLPSEMTRSNTGSYLFTLEARHKETGCKASDQVAVEVPQKWKYRYYESDPNVLSVVEGEEVQIWKGKSLIGGNWIYPIMSNPIITWNGSTPNVLNSSYNVPSGVKFKPTIARPQLIMTVTDPNTGCNLSIASAKYIVTARKPRIDIKMSNYSLCKSSLSGEKVTIQFDPYLLGPIPSYMPPYVILNIDYSKDVKLDFSPITKLYKGEFDLANLPIGKHTMVVAYYSGDNNGVFGENIQETLTFEVLNNEQISSPPNAVMCDFDVLSPNVVKKKSLSLYSGCPSSPSGLTYLKRGEVSAESYIWIGSSNNATLEDKGGQYPAQQTGLHFYINQCLSEGLTNPPTEERIESITLLPPPTMKQEGLDITILPTPFHSEVNIQFSFEATEAQAIDLELYDITGRKVALLRQWNSLEPGVYSEIINMEAFAPGMYTYVLRLSNGKQISKQSIKI
jgi:PKD repeat protein